MSKINWDKKISTKVSARAAEVKAIKERLVEVDIACIRPLVTMLIHGETPEDIAILKGLRAKADALRSSLD